MEKDSKMVESQRVQQQELENQSKVLTCLRQYTALTSELYKFQSLLYEKSVKLPRQIYKHFRSIRDIVESTFNTLEGYVTFNQEFIEEKDRILQEQIQVTESQIGFSQVKTSSEDGFGRRRRQTEYSGWKQKKSEGEWEGKQMQILRGQIQNLKNQLRQNDSEYEIQIKKYNMKYDEMMQEISFYQEKMGLVDEYEETIEQLEVEIRVMKEIKERDDQLIRSMARKIKNIELERNGRSLMISPSRTIPTFASPVRVRSQVSQLSPKVARKIY